MKPEAKQKKKRENRKQRATNRRNKNKSRGKPSKTPKQPKAKEATSTPTPEIVPSKLNKNLMQVQKAKVTAVKKAARPILKKKVKLLSEKKFKELRFKMQLHITISQKERDVYRTICVAQVEEIFGLSVLLLFSHDLTINHSIIHSMFLSSIPRTSCTLCIHTCRNNTHRTETHEVHLNA